MATIKDNIGNGINGKIGKKFTVYQRLGQTIIRTLPEDFQPTSEGALAQQKRLSGCTTFYKGGGAERVLETGGEGGRANRVQPVYEREHAGVFGTGMD